MTDPIKIEQEFQTLKQLLGLLSSPRLRLLKIAEFFRPLMDPGGPAFLDAYLPEILPKFVSLILQTDFIGTNTAFLDELASIAAAYAKDDRPEKEACQRAIDYLQVQKSMIADAVSGRAKRREPRKAFTQNVWIPLVEQEQLVGTVESCFATLQKFRAEVRLSDERDSADELIIDNYSSGIDSKQHLDPAVASAKRLLKRWTGHYVKGKLIAHFSCQTKSSVVGDSFGAGFAAALFIQFLRLFQHREEFSIQEDVAITGRVTDEGEILPVDEGGLKLKVESCAFSRIRYLAVPKGQEELCRTHLENLSAGGDAGLRRHPLEIIGISRLEDIFNDRRLSSQRLIPILYRVGRKTWRHRRSVAGAVFLVLLGIIWRLWYGPLDKIPDHSRLKGHVLVVENKYGEELDEVQIKGTMYPSDVAVQNRVCFYDVDSDGIKEMIWAENRCDSSRNISSVMCRKLGARELMWNHPLTKEMIFPNKEDVTESRLDCGEIIVGDLDRDSTPEVYLHLVHSFFPNLIMKLDARTGRELGCYVHVGGISTLKFADIDSDGIQELIIAAGNQAFGEACLAILDPPVHQRLFAAHAGI